MLAASTVAIAVLDLRAARITRRMPTRRGRRPRRTVGAGVSWDSRTSDILLTDHCFEKDVLNLNAHCARLPNLLRDCNLRGPDAGYGPNLARPNYAARAGGRYG